MTERRRRPAPITTAVVVANAVVLVALLWSAGPWFLQLLDSPLAPVTFMLIPQLGWDAWVMPVTLILFGWLGGDLERTWGSARFGLFLGVTSAVSYLALRLGTGHGLAGPAAPLANLLVAWTVVFPWYSLRV
ncbi:MAG: hypothetical protein AB1758_22150, partial [Candidatus Eremiobacterota bacterium]